MAHPPDNLAGTTETSPRPDSAPGVRIAGTRSGGSVLVVDDMEDMREIISELLTRDGYSVRGRPPTVPKPSTPSGARCPI